MSNLTSKCNPPASAPRALGFRVCSPQPAKTRLSKHLKKATKAWRNTWSHRHKRSLPEYALLAQEVIAKINKPGYTKPQIPAGERKWKGLTPREDCGPKHHKRVRQK